MCNNVPKGIQVILAPALEESRTLASNSPKCTRSIRSTGTRVSPCSTYYNRTKVQWERNPDSSIQDTGTNAGRDFRRPEGEGAVEPSKQKKGTGREVQDQASKQAWVGSDGAAAAAGAVDDGVPFLRFPPPDGSPAASFSSLPSPPLPSLRSVLCSLAVGQSWALLGWAVDNSMLGSPNENPACPCDNDECLAEMIPQKKKEQK